MALSSAGPGVAFGTTASVIFVQSSNPCKLSLPRNWGDYEGQMRWEILLGSLGLLQYVTHCIWFIDYQITY